MKSIPIADADRKQLANYAELVLGLPAPAANASRAKIVAAIKTARGEDEEDEAKLKPIIVDEAEPRPDDIGAASPPPAAKAEGEHAHALRPKTFRGYPTAEITIHEDQSKEGKRPVFVGANGISILIPRGKRVEIASPFYYALMDCVQYIYSQREDENTGKVLEECAVVPRFAITVHREPADQKKAA